MNSEFSLILYRALVVLTVYVFEYFMISKRIRNITLSLIIVIKILLAAVLFLIEPISAIVGLILTSVLLIRKRLNIMYDLEENQSYYDFSSPVKSIKGIWNNLTRNAKNDGSIIIGSAYPFTDRDLDINNKSIIVDETVLGGGTLITGASGSGKTTTMESMMKQHLDNGNPLAFFDFKGEKEIIDKFKKYCNERSIDFYEFSAYDIDFRYDPLLRLNETGRVSALMNIRKWDTRGADDHFRSSTQLFAQNIIREYDSKRNKDNSNYLIGLYDFIQNYKVDINERDGYLTIKKMIEIILTSAGGKMFKDNSLKEFSFYNEKQFMVCFSFLSSNKELGNSLASFVFKDLLDRGTNKKYNPKLGLYVDEFGSLENTEIVKDILEKGRSAGIQTVLSVQDINQISLKSSELFLESMLGTINSFIIHAGAVQSAATKLSSVQSYNADWAILELQKPYNGKPPTALFISKYPVLKRGKKQQTVVRIFPYIYNSNNTKNGIKVEKTKENIVLDNKNDIEIPKEEIKEDNTKEIKENSFNFNDFM